MHGSTHAPSRINADSGIVISGGWGTLNEFTQGWVYPPATAPPSSEMRPVPAARDSDTSHANSGTQQGLAILTMRFGAVPDDVRERIEACRDVVTLDHLILVAANVPDWSVFLDELASERDEFKLLGEPFDPLAAATRSIRVKDGSCVGVCPVDCIHPAEGESDYDNFQQLYINPNECIDCGACEPACPVTAIFEESAVPGTGAGLPARGAMWRNEDACGVLWG